MRLELYEIDELLYKKLSKIDEKISNFNENKCKRPFVGILIKVENKNYFAPLSSPKDKHKHMKTKIDFVKIDNGLLGVINLNNMIPINDNYVKKIDPTKLSCKNDDEIKYKNLINKQLSWINETKNKKNIIMKANMLREKYLNNKLPYNIRKRCVNFNLLEKIDLSDKSIENEK